MRALFASTLHVCAALLFAGESAAQATHGAPVEDCRPCRFEVGGGAPDMLVNFVWEGDGAARRLAALRVTPVGRAPQPQTLPLDSPIPSKDAPGGFLLIEQNVDGDDYADLGLSSDARNGDGAHYWTFQPASLRFAPVEWPGAGDAGLALGRDPARDFGTSYRHISAAEHDLTWLRFDDGRLEPVRRETQRVDAQGRIVRIVEDLSGDAPRTEWRSVVFAAENPPPADFLSRIATAHDEALELYRAGKPADAAQALDPYFADYAFDSLDPEARSSRLTAQLNDYGFFLQEAGDNERAIDVLKYVLERDPDRMVAYLNLADAQYAAGYRSKSWSNYVLYRDMMTEAGKTGKIPSRVFKRID